MTSWREHFKVHPSAAVFPMMPDDELAELAKDIEKNCLRNPIALWRDENDVTWLIDGRNRAEAMFGIIGWGIAEPSDKFKYIEAAKDEVAGIIIGFNIHRRHLTKAEQAKLIYEAVKASKSDNAKLALSETKRVFPGGVKGGSTPDPILQEATATAAMFGISPRTVQRAVAKPKAKMPKAKAPPTDDEMVGRAIAVWDGMSPDACRTFIRMVMNRPKFPSDLFENKKGPRDAQACGRGPISTDIGTEDVS